MSFIMGIDVFAPQENKESIIKKGSLFDAIFGGKMQALLDKISIFLGGNKEEKKPVENRVPIESLGAQNKSDATKRYEIPVAEKKEKVSSTSVLGDMTDLATKYPKEAWAKNNNPSGITMPMSSELRSKLDAAGIRYEVGSKRPRNEGGNYVKFATMDEGIRAKKIVLMKGNMVVRDRLAKWVGHKDIASNYRYADSILKAANVDGSKRFSELSDSEMDALMMKQIKQESSGLYKELLARNVTPIADNIA